VCVREGERARERETERERERESKGEREIKTKSRACFFVRDFVLHESERRRVCVFVCVSAAHCLCPYCKQ